MNNITASGNNQIIGSQATMAELYGRFIAYIDATPKTIDTYRKSLKQMFNYFNLNGITQPKREDILSYREHLKTAGYKPTTTQGYITAARLFFQWAAQEGLYPNIADRIKGAKLNRDHKKDYLTTRQAKEVLKAAKKDTLQGLRDYAIITLMMTCGLRTIEVIRANIEDMRTAGDNMALYLQGKGREEKTEFINLPEAAEKAIRSYLKARQATDPTEPLFTSLSNNSKGQRLSTRAISGLVKEKLIIAGYDSPRLTAHSLRHTAVTLSILAGKELSEVQQYARHADINTTMIYNHSLEMAKNGCSEAVAALLFD